MKNIYINSENWMSLFQSADGVTPEIRSQIIESRFYQTQRDLKCYPTQTASGVAKNTVVQNTAARLLTRSRRTTDITPVLSSALAPRQVHDFKVLLFTY